MAKFSKEDKAIMDANPNASPHELLLAGLSEEGFNKMVEAESERVNNAAKTALKTAKPNTANILQPAQPMQPVLGARKAPYASRSTHVRLRPKNSNLIGTSMSREAAERMQRQYPNLYEII